VTRPSDLRRRDIGRQAADRLLSGDLDPDAAPPGYDEIARLVAVAADPAPAPGDEALVTAMATAVRSAPEPAAPRPAVSGSAGTRFSRKVAAAALAVTLGSTGVAAAATGNLPDAAQDRVASVVGHVGIDLPESASTKATTVREAIESTPPGAERGAAVSDAARSDRAGEAPDGASERDQHGPPDHAPAGPPDHAPGPPSHAPGPQDHAPAPPDHAPANPGPPDHAPANPGPPDHAPANPGPPSHAPADPGPPSATPGTSGGAAVETPNPGGTSTADGASGGASTQGTSRANDAAGAGAANAPGPGAEQPTQSPPRR
jgi:hypothetical protein